MFTGITSDLGTVRAVEKGGDKRFVIATAYDVEAIATGASIGCSGACLSVVEKGVIEDAEDAGDAGWLAFDVSAETLACTTLGSWRTGTRVNLERPLKVGDELGGHIVLGHVDGVARVAAREPVGDSLRLAFAVPDGLAGYVAAKGSVAVDGVSLTVNWVEGDVFEVNIIPHTMRLTTLGALQPGGVVNLEVDVLARYVARLNQSGPNP